ncbi:hypothetical protein [Paenibacillus sp. Root52]|uniref:hypothetical protein n=1 Tax=Paenibacillus sp. Root52 TaxID=1736552 RepID=UPI0009E8D1EA|nr:hypothetical protein [Paenibacillus sp. Root52]
MRPIGKQFSDLIDSEKKKFCHCDCKISKAQNEHIQAEQGKSSQRKAEIEAYLKQKKTRKNNSVPFESKYLASPNLTLTMNPS